MPTYGYECKSCSNKFDVFQAISDEPVKTCPECGKGVRRLIFGGTGVIFKGSGFYVTDKNKGSTRNAGNSGDASPAGDTSPTGCPGAAGTDGSASPACAGCPANTAADSPKTGQSASGEGGGSRQKPKEAASKTA